MNIVLSRLLAWGPATMRRRVHTVRGRNEGVHAEHRSAGERTRAHVKCVPVSCVRQCSSTSSRVETCPVRRVALSRGCFSVGAPGAV